MIRYQFWINPNDAGAPSYQPVKPVLLVLDMLPISPRPLLGPFKHTDAGFDAMSRAVETHYGTTAAEYVISCAEVLAECAKPW